MGSNRQGFIYAGNLHRFSWERYLLAMEQFDKRINSRGNLTKFELLQLRCMISILTYTECRPNELLLLTLSDIKTVEYNEGLFYVFTFKNSKHHPSRSGKKIIDRKPIKSVPVKLSIQDKHPEEFKEFIEPMVAYIEKMKKEKDWTEDLKLFGNWTRFRLYYYFIQGTYTDEKDLKNGINIYGIKHISVQHDIIDNGLGLADVAAKTGHRNLQSLSWYFQYSYKDILKRIDEV
jgi:hypothetical protein